jgi:hypothetical protein
LVKKSKENAVLQASVAKAGSKQVARELLSGSTSDFGRLLTLHETNAAMANGVIATLAHKKRPGNGGGGSHQFATVAPDLAMTSSEFSVI